MDVKGEFPTFTSTLAAPSGVTGLGARVETLEVRAIVSAWHPAVLAAGVWTVTLERPQEPGDYALVWLTADPEPPAAFELFEALTLLP